MKTKEKIRSGSVKVDPDALQRAKEICKQKGYLLNVYVTNAILMFNSKHRDK